MNNVDYTNFVVNMTAHLLTDNEFYGNMALGVVGELGEVVDLVKKFKYHGKPFNKEQLTLELGDVWFYCTAIIARTDVPYIIELGTYDDGTTSEELLLPCVNLAADIYDAVFSWTVNYVLAADYCNDLLCELFMFADYHEISIYDIRQANYEKLVARHGGTSFNKEIRAND